MFKINKNYLGIVLTLFSEKFRKSGGGGEGGGGGVEIFHQKTNCEGYFLLFHQKLGYVYFLFVII